MTPTVSSPASGAPPPSSPAAAGATANPTVSKNMFLQLLVAQIKNQDPLNPADGVQFLTQLAQFTQLEQTISLSADVAAIRDELQQLVPPTQNNPKGD